MYLEQFALIVEDYDSALRFFVDALGFELVEDSPSLTNDGRSKRWVVVRPPGATSARCCSLRLMAGRKRVRSEVSSRSASACSCGSTTSRPPTTRMRNMRAEFVTEPRHEPYGQAAVFVDIAGNRWDLLGPRPAR
ncbi:MAG: VOC family protein [Dermatophilaceae bacterium]